LPFPASGGALLFHLISQLYEKTSLITHHESVVRRVGAGVWGCEDDDALLDRVTHHCDILEQATIPSGSSIAKHRAQKTEKVEKIGR